MTDELDKFIKREAKASQVFDIREIDKKVGYEFVKQYHYLEGAKYLAIHSVGLYHKGTLVGVATYSTPQGIVALKGWFGLPNTDTSIMELSRLCMSPELNGSNATSYLLSNSMKLLRKRYGVRAVTTLADNSRHVGAIYQVCNFKYYGLSDSKTDFYAFLEDGKFKKNPRGATKDVQGVWTARPRKHRYAFIMDNSLKCLYEEQPRPSKSDYLDSMECSVCKGSAGVLDKRYGVKYSCPQCTGNLTIIKEDE